MSGPVLLMFPRLLRVCTRHPRKKRTTKWGICRSIWAGFGGASAPISFAALFLPILECRLEGVFGDASILGLHLQGVFLIA